VGDAARRLDTGDYTLSHFATSENGGLIFRVNTRSFRVEHAVIRGAALILVYIV